MPRLFISHSSKDNVEALAFQSWLSANGWSRDDVFVDLHSIGAGERWRDTLRKANASAEAVILLASPDSLESLECQKELELAEALGKEIIIAILRDLERNDPRLARFSERQFVDLSTEPTERMEPLEYDGRLHRVEFNMAALGAIKTRLTNLGIAPGSFAWPPRGVPNPEPFPGLAAFGEEDAGIFFGRDADIMSALTEIRIIRRRRTPRLIVIDAASGAGKSSFLRAGLWPRLRRDPDFAPLAILRPAQGIITGPDGLGRGFGHFFERHGKLKPPGAIHSSIAAGDVATGAAALSSLLSEATELATQARRAGHDDARPPAPVIAIDQAEEVFSAENEAESRHFLALLARVLTDPPDDVDPYVILTIRADSVQSLLTRIAELELETPKALYLPPLSPLAYRDVILKPAEVYAERVRRLTFEPALVTALVDDAAGADALPLLAFTLSQLFGNYAPAGQLTLGQYREMGGASGSIGRALSAAMARAGATGTQENLRRLIVPRLATWDPDADQRKGAAKRVVATLDSVIGGERASLAPLVNTLVTARLLMQSRDTLEVAHEALLRQPPISDWLEENREFLVWRDRLARERASFEANHRGYLVGRELQIARDWLKARAADDIAAPDRQFVLDSVAEDDRRRTVEETQEQKRQEAELTAARAQAQAAAAEARAAEERVHASRRVVRRTVAGLVGALAFALLASGAGIFAWQQQTEALTQRREAITQASHAETARGLAEAMSRTADTVRREAQINQSRFLADLSRQATDQGDAVTGMLLALEALPDAKGDDELTRGREHWPPAEASLVHARRMLREERVFRGHERSVLGVAVFPDGKRIATGSDDRTVRIWDAATGVQTARLEGHTNSVNAVAVSADGKFIASASRDGTARLWNAATGAEIGVLKVTNRVGAIAIFPDGKRIVTGTDENNAAQVWDVATGERLLELRGHSDWVRGVAVTADGARIVTGSHDRTTRIWDAQTGRQIARLSGHTNQIESIAVFADGRIVTGSSDNTARVWDAGGAEVAVLRGHTGRINAVAVTPDGTRVLTGSSDDTVRIWDAKTGSELAKRTGHVGATFALAVAPDGSRFVAGGTDGTARSWDITTTTEIAVIRGHTDDVNGVAVSHDGTRIISTADDRSVRVWDARSGAETAVLTGHTNLVLDVVELPDGDTIVSASADASARIWSLKAGREVRQLKGHTGSVRGVAATPDGTRIVTASQDRTIRIWETATGKELRAIPVSGPELHSVSVASDGERIVSGASDGSAVVWSMTTGAELLRLKGHTSGVRSVAFTRDGARIVTGGDDRTARVWDAKSGKELVQFKINTAAVWKVAVTDDGIRVLTGGADGVLRIWNSATGGEIAQIRAHTGGIYGLAITPDGARFVTGSWDDTIKVWHLFTEGQRLIDDSKRHAPRCLTPGQRQRYYLPPEPPRWCLAAGGWPFDAVGGPLEAIRLLRGNRPEEDQEADTILKALAPHEPDIAKRVDGIWAAAYIERGERLLENGRHEEASAQFALAAERDRDPATRERVTSVFVNFHVSRGRQLIEDGKEGEAKAQFEQALARDGGAAKRINESWSAALVSRGERLVRDGKLEEARAQFAVALERDPGASTRIDQIWVRTLLANGERLLREGKTEEAEAQFTLAMERDRSVAAQIGQLRLDGLLARGENLVIEGRDEEAAAQFAQAIARDPKLAQRI